MENFDRENIDELLEIHQIRQYFPRQNFAPYDSAWFLLQMIKYQLVFVYVYIERS